MPSFPIAGDPATTPSRVNVHRKDPSGLMAMIRLKMVSKKENEKRKKLQSQIEEHKHEDSPLGELADLIGLCT